MNAAVSKRAVLRMTLRNDRLIRAVTTSPCGVVPAAIGTEMS